MSQVHKVINLKTPLKIFGLTIKQLIALAFGGILGFIVASKCPGDWKVGNLPIGLFAFVIIISLGGALGFMTELKPFAWWKNSILFTLGLQPRIIVPRPEEGQIYPDPTIIEKRVAEEFYIEQD